MTMDMDWHEPEAQRTGVGNQIVSSDAALSAALDASNRAVKAHALQPGAPRLLSDSARRMHLTHWMKLASKPPACVIAWTTPGQPTARLVGDGNAVYMRSRCAIAACGVATTEELADFTHEVAHHRTVGRATGTLNCERLAWEFAREHALVWDRRSQARMRHCLQTYLDQNRDRSAETLLEVHDIETRLFSEDSFRQHERNETPGMLQAFEEKLFVETHGSRRCESGFSCHGRAVAQLIDGGRFSCRACAERSKLDQMIRSQRARADAMRPRWAK
jgi:hypothetical protein